eukprot:762622-Amphidinium_carterae.2
MLIRSLRSKTIPYDSVPRFVTCFCHPSITTKTGKHRRARSYEGVCNLARTNFEKSTQISTFS